MRTNKLTFRERLADIERVLSIESPKPLPFKISRTERVLMELLLKRDILTREIIWEIFYGHRPDADQPQYHVVSQFVRLLRKRLKPFNIKITTEYGVGWYLEKDDKVRLQRLVDNGT